MPQITTTGYSFAHINFKPSFWYWVLFWDI